MTTRTARSSSSPRRRDALLGALEMNLDLGFATLTSSTSYYDHSGDSTSENTGFYAQAGFLSFYYNYPRPMASAVRTWSDRSLIEELRLVSDTGDKFDYVVGLWYQDQNRDAGQDSFLRGFKRWWATPIFAPELEDVVTGDQDFYYRFEDDFTETAVYGELTWHITDRVDLTGGLRWFDNDSNSHSVINLPLYASLDDQTSATLQDERGRHALFKGNVAIHVSDDDLVYLTYSEGYRRGGANAVPTTGFFAESPAWLTYTSDTVENYEIGIKGPARRPALRPVGVPDRLERPAAQYGDAELGLLRGRERRKRGIERRRAAARGRDRRAA